jgi:hypothetical protein
MTPDSEVEAERCEARPAGMRCISEGANAG